jgi:hypothetical protein
MSWQDFTNRAPGDMITAAIWNQDVGANPTALLPVALEFFIDGGGAVIGAGVAGVLEVPFKCDITAARMVADQAGTLQVDVNRATYSGVPTYSSLTASATPILSAVQKSQDTTLTGWTTALAAGDWLQFQVDASPAPASVTWCQVSLRASRS